MESLKHTPTKHKNRQRTERTHTKMGAHSSKIEKERIRVSSTRTIETEASSIKLPVTQSLPFPYSLPDSKVSETFHETLVGTLLEKYAKHDTGFATEHFALSSVCEFPDMTVDIATYFDLTAQMFQNFSDFHFEYKLLGETEPGVVVAEIQACGVHDGLPCHTERFLTPLPAKQVVSRNDPEFMTCHFRGTKIAKISFLPISSSTTFHGPDGFYRQIQVQNKKLNGAVRSSKGMYVCSKVPHTTAIVLPVSCHGFHCTDGFL